MPHKKTDVLKMRLRMAQGQKETQAEMSFINPKDFLDDGNTRSQSEIEYWLSNSLGALNGHKNKNRRSKE